MDIPEKVKAKSQENNLRAYAKLLLDLCVTGVESVRRGQYLSANVMGRRSYATDTELLNMVPIVQKL